MPSGPRIRANNVFGTILDNPLTNVATTINSAGLANLPAVSSAHAIIVLDPRRVYGAPEIIVVTAHTAAATSATVTRGQYGTAARAHPLGAEWIHSPIDEDFIEVLTSGTRPSNPYEGQLIFETDTNKLVGYGGVDWAPRDAGGTLGFATNVADQGSITTLVDLTSLSVPVTVGTGRRVLITGTVSMVSTVGGDLFNLYIREGATTLRIREWRTTVNNVAETATVRVVITPTAGAHTYKLSAERGFLATGTFTVIGTGDRHADILVEDIGAA